MARSISTDRFGNSYQVIGCKPSKKNPDFAVGYVELGGKLYKLEPSEANKDGVSFWVRVTHVKKQNRPQSM
ncbi:hypothetical protein [Flavobacterium sp. XGLA_31]|uniref:hypothetical protein n=1 Tax=Flavobacterium sp. XGLA_31 TaxID=3447666 RepID=UPI003F2FD919